MVTRYNRREGSADSGSKKFGRTIGTWFAKICNYHLAKCLSDCRCATLFATPPAPRAMGLGRLT